MNPMLNCRSKRMSNVWLLTNLGYPNHIRNKLPTSHIVAMVMAVKICIIKKRITSKVGTAHTQHSANTWNLTMKKEISIQK